CDPVYKLVNSAVQLDVPKKIVDDDLTWIFNQSENIVKYTGRLRVLGRFAGRVKFDEETHSLTLYSVQKNDSGLYQAEYSGVKKEIGATYQIHVLDPVSKPVFNISCLRSKNTSNVTFTCEAQELKITSDCYNDNCDIKKETITGHPFLFLSLYISNNLIICNHSNPVSWENTAVERKTKEQHCHSAEFPPDPEGPGIILPVIIIAIFLLAILLLVIFFWQKKRKTRDSVNTVYEAVDPVMKEENNAQSVEMSERPEHPGTLYCTVGKPAEAFSNDESTVRTANPGNKEMRRMRSEENRDDRNLCDIPDK
ncbi:CD48 antigen-like, partial [Clarias magur]